MAKTIMEMVAEIVAEFLANQSRWLTEEDVASVIKRTYRELKEIETLEVSGASLEEIDKSLAIQHSAPATRETDKEPAVTKPKVDPLKSITDEAIFCIECGAGFKTLTHTHLGHHGLTSDEYKKKWGIPANQPLAARSVSEKRKEAARVKNVGEFLKQRRALARGGELSNPTEAGPEQDKE